jgi:hypothetical protein
MRTRTLATTILAAATLAVALAAAGPAAADCWGGCDPGTGPGQTSYTLASSIVPLENGGFESPDIPPRSWGVFSSIPGWRATNPWCGIEVQDHVAGAPAEGDQFVELNANCRSGISSPALPVTPGKYRLAFKYSPRPGTPAEANYFAVRMNNSEISYLPGAGGSETNWTAGSQSLNVYSGTSSLTIQFVYIGSSPSAVGAYIDDVRLYKDRY